MSRILFVALLVLLGCAALEDDPNPPGPFPHGGTGEFRPLSRAETGVSGSPPGLALFIQGAFDSGSVTTDGRLFYASGLLLSDAPEPMTDPVPGEVDWSAFEPRRIFRSEPQLQPAFMFGEEVLAASESWEGEELFEPWTLVRADGSALLYYAASGGIGVATASTVDGSFTRPGSTPVLAADGGDVPRRPSAVELDDRVLLYFDSGRGVGLATSTDGVSFTRVTDALDFGPDPIDDGSAEVSVGGPGAVVVQTSAGRRILRLYFESRRDDGRHLIGLAASLDGENFERFGRSVLDAEDRLMPAPVFVDAQTTLLYLTAPRDQRGREVRGLIATVAPRTIRFEED